MNSKLEALCLVRDHVPGDLPFIMATMLQGLWYPEASWYHKIPKDIFFANYKHVLEGLLDKPDTVVKVVSLREDPDVILGYSILSGDFQTVHWVHVKSAWRRNGVARSLLPTRPTFVTHLSPLGESLIPKLESQPLFNPFKI